ncbi:hypothetical protein ACFXHA_42560 [Nocardia sp. NPDC059240]|uniref:hypothetical protein n=1 Tax=Nocardia sp. NPDC059240 TaxID=3346786 RepID=UPI0036A8B0B2
MATPAVVLAWDLSGLPGVAANATAAADTIIKSADTMHTAIHDDLAWKGKAGDAARGKADKEQQQMRAVATAYDHLATACTGAYDAMNQPLADLKSIFANYVAPPVVVHDDWSVTGIENPDSEAGIQLARIPGLADALLAADLAWGMKILTANDEISSMAPGSALSAETAMIQRIKKEDTNAISDAIAANPTSFWKPDIPGMTAASVVGGMTEATRMGLESAAREAGDTTVLKWVENWGKSATETGITKEMSSGLSHFGIYGNLIGTIPAIANDIRDGEMDPTKAVVTEVGGAEIGLVSGGMVGGFLAGAMEGTALGTAVPGVGNAVGFVVGGAVGALAAYGGSKGLQWLWDR